MSNEDKIYDFLAQPENLAIAFQVAEYVQMLRKKVHREFWPMFTQTMQDRIDTSEYVESWRFFPLPDNNWGKSWGTCSIQFFNSIQNNRPMLQVSLQQGTPNNNFRLLMGVCWTSPPSREINSTEFEQLKSKLKAMNYTQSSPKWPAWNWLSYRLEGEQNILKMYNEPESFIQELVDIFWQLFIDIRPLLEAINKEVTA